MDPISALHLTGPAGLQSDALVAPPPELSGARSASEAEELPKTATGSNFDGMLKNFVTEVDQKQAAAGYAVSGLLSGQPVPLHQAVIAMEEASVSFQLMVEVRNKLLESYQELMRMQI